MIDDSCSAQTIVAPRDVDKSSVCLGEAVVNIGDNPESLTS